MAGSTIAEEQVAAGGEGSPSSSSSSSSSGGGGGDDDAAGGEVKAKPLSAADWCGNPAPAVPARSARSEAA